MRTATGTIDGHTYEIPEMWLAGFCRTNGCTVPDAFAWWHEQEKMEAAFQAQLAEEVAA
jgi:hypothetical protein